MGEVLIRAFKTLYIVTYAWNLVSATSLAAERVLVTDRHTETEAGKMVPSLTIRRSARVHVLSSLKLSELSVPAIFFLPSFFAFFVVRGFEPRTLHMLGNRSTMEPHPQPVAHLPFLVIACPSTNH